PAIAAAIRSADTAKLVHFLSPAFRGETLDPSQGTGPQNEALKVRRTTAPNQSAAARKVDASSFAKYLIDLRSRFGPEVKVELALMSLSPLNRAKLDGPWQGTC